MDSSAPTPGFGKTRLVGEQIEQINSDLSRRNAESQDASDNFSLPRLPTMGARDIIREGNLTKSSGRGNPFPLTLRHFKEVLCELKDGFGANQTTRFKQLSQEDGLDLLNETLFEALDSCTPCADPSGYATCWIRPPKPSLREGATKECWKNNRRNDHRSEYSFPRAARNWRIVPQYVGAPEGVGYVDISFCRELSCALWTREIGVRTGSALQLNPGSDPYGNLSIKAHRFAWNAAGGVMWHKGAIASHPYWRLAASQLFGCEAAKVQFGMFQCSHLCVDLGCWNPAHFVDESQALNLSRRGCIGFAYVKGDVDDFGKQLVWRLCRHNPPCCTFVALPDHQTTLDVNPLYNRPFDPAVHMPILYSEWRKQMDAKSAESSPDAQVDEDRSVQWLRNKKVSNDVHEIVGDAAEAILCESPPAPPSVEPSVNEEFDPERLDEVKQFELGDQSQEISQLTQDSAIDDEDHNDYYPDGSPSVSSDRILRPKSSNYLRSPGSIGSLTAAPPVVHYPSSTPPASPGGTVLVSTPAREPTDDAFTRIDYFEDPGLDGLERRISTLLDVNPRRINESNLWDFLELRDDILNKEFANNRQRGEDGNGWAADDWMEREVYRPTAEACTSGLLVLDKLASSWIEQHRGERTLREQSKRKAERSPLLSPDKPLPPLSETTKTYRGRQHRMVRSPPHVDQIEDDISTLKLREYHPSDTMNGKTYLRGRKRVISNRSFSRISLVRFQGSPGTVRSVRQQLIDDKQK